MKYQLTLGLLGSIACCAIVGCQPNQGVSSTANNPDREVTQAPDSDEAAISTVSTQQRSKKPIPKTRTGRSRPAVDGPPSIETELSSGSPPATAADDEAQTEVRELFFANGETRRKWLVKVLPDGTEVEHGEWIRWYDNGQVRLQGEYVDGLREGLLLSWWPNGQKRGEGRLHRNRHIGTWIMWDDKGQKRSEVAYEIGLKHGKSTLWDAEGNVIKSGEYVRNKKHGLWMTGAGGETTETEWVNGVEVE